MACSKLGPSVSGRWLAVFLPAFINLRVGRYHGVKFTIKQLGGQLCACVHGGYSAHHMAGIGQQRDAVAAGERGLRAEQVELAGKSRETLPGFAPLTSETRRQPVRL